MVTAVLLVSEKVSVEWLGSSLVASLCVSELSRVRGIDRRICFVGESLAIHIESVCERFGFDCTNVKDKDIPTGAMSDAWIKEKVPGDIYLVYRPVTPFIPSGKIQKCLSLIAGATAYAAPVRRCKMRVSANRVRTVDNAVSNLYAFDKKLSDGRDPPVAPVPLTLIESLDLTIPDERTIAMSLVASGDV